MAPDLITVALGLFWNNSGARAWSLQLAPDRAISVQYTFLESVQVALRLQMKFWRTTWRHDYLQEADRQG